MVFFSQKSLVYVPDYKRKIRLERVSMKISQPPFPPFLKQPSPLQLTPSLPLFLKNSKTQPPCHVILYIYHTYPCYLYEQNLNHLHTSIKLQILSHEIMFLLLLPVFVVNTVHICYT